MGFSRCFLLYHSASEFTLSNFSEFHCFSGFTGENRFRKKLNFVKLVEHRILRSQKPVIRDFQVVQHPDSVTDAIERFALPSCIWLQILILPTFVLFTHCFGFAPAVCDQWRQEFWGRPSHSFSQNFAFWVFSFSCCLADCISFFKRHRWKLCTVMGSKQPLSGILKFRNFGIRTFFRRDERKLMLCR